MLYETEDNRKAQEFIVASYAEVCAYTYQMKPKRCVWDAELFRGGKLQAVVEVKDRDVKRFAYQTYKIDKAKVDGLLSAADARAVLALLLVRFKRQIFWIELSRKWLNEHAGAARLERRDRGDPLDRDRVYEWKNFLWQPIGEE